jgi:hypothetical protein
MTFHDFDVMRPGICFGIRNGKPDQVRQLCAGSSDLNILFFG